MITDAVTREISASGLPVEEIVRSWRDSGDFTEQTLLRSEETLLRFVARLERQGVTTWQAVGPGECAGFIDARTRDGRVPELATRHARRTVLRLAFRTLRQLGLSVGDPTLDVVLPPRTSRPARPLTDDEVTLGRAAARLGSGSRSLRTAVAWALAEATAVTSEISSVRLADLDDAIRPSTVQLPGTRRHDPRPGTLTDWGRTVLARHLATLVQPDARTLLIYRGAAPPGQHVAQASVCNAVANALRAAGLSAQPDVRPGSVRGWAGRSMYDAGMPVEEVARRLGCRSLDAAAEDIDLSWRTQ